MSATPMMWGVFAAVVAIALVVDFLLLNRQGAHTVSLREAALWSVVWLVVSLAFVGWLWLHWGGLSDDAQAADFAHDKAMEYVTGYLVEKALAVDNIFVFLLLFTYFSVPAQFQKRVLMIGILGALVLRAGMILGGAWLIERFHWILYVFGLFLIYTGFRMWRAAGKEPDLDSNPALQWVRRHMKVAEGYEGQRLFIRREGERHATPLFVVVLLIGVVDIIFAVDSIPAIFAITTDPFIVLTSNVFAILGLRALYFLLAGMHDRFHLLSYGLAIVLILIGTKMLLMDVVKIPTWASLVATVAVLAASIVLSLRKPGKGRSAYPFQPRKQRAEQSATAERQP